MSNEIDAALKHYRKLVDEIVKATIKTHKLNSSHWTKGGKCAPELVDKKVYDLAWRALEEMSEEKSRAFCILMPTSDPDFERFSDEMERRFRCDDLATPAFLYRLYKQVTAS